MDHDRITREKVDELLRYLPLFELPGRQFVKRWVGGDKTADGALTAPYPIYLDDVLTFFQLAGQPCWSDYGYDPAQVSQMLKDDTLIEEASLEEIKSMLTYCVRGERFSDGHWDGVLKSGQVTAILRRLAVLRASLSEAE
jgi:hypothetical protein